MPLPNPQKGFSPIIIILGVALLFLIAAILWYFNLAPQNKTNTVLETNNQPAKRATPREISANLSVIHPSLFYADLEYDPKQQLITQHKAGQTNGDISGLDNTQPSGDSTKFIYKIEIFSESNDLIYSGWKSIPKTVIETPNNNFRFLLTAPYQKNSLIQVFLTDGKNIWSSKMP